MTFSFGKRLRRLFLWHFSLLFCIYYYWYRTIYLWHFLSASGYAASFYDIFFRQAATPPLFMTFSFGKRLRRLFLWHFSLLFCIYYYWYRTIYFNKRLRRFFPWLSSLWFCIFYYWYTTIYLWLFLSTSILWFCMYFYSFFKINYFFV